MELQGNSLKKKKKRPPVPTQRFWSGRCKVRLEISVLSQLPEGLQGGQSVGGGCMRSSIVFCAARLQRTFCDSMRPMSSSSNLLITRRAMLASQLQASGSGFLLQPAVSLESSSKLQRTRGGAGSHGRRGGPEAVKCCRQKGLTHDRETTRLVKAFPSPSPVIKRGTGSSFAKSPFCRWLEP